MCDDVERGQRIADSIRKVLFNCDLRLIHAQSELDLANQDFKLYSKLDGQANQRKALRAKAKRDTYKIYVENIGKIKNQVKLNLNNVLARYTPKYQKIWYMYFIEQATIDEICTAVSYSKGNVNIIIKKLKMELNHHFNGGE